MDTLGIDWAMNDPVAYPGEGPAPPPLFLTFRLNWGPKLRKKIFSRPGPPSPYLPLRPAPFLGGRGDWDGDLIRYILDSRFKKTYFRFVHSLSLLDYFCPFKTFGQFYISWDIATSLGPVRGSRKRLSEPRLLGMKVTLRNYTTHILIFTMNDIVEIRFTLILPPCCR